MLNKMPRKSTKELALDNYLATTGRMHIVQLATTQRQIWIDGYKARAAIEATAASQQRADFVELLENLRANLKDATKAGERNDADGVSMWLNTALDQVQEAIARHTN